MALPPDGCSPRPDGILGQVQEESKSPFFFTSGHVLRYIEYPGVHTTHGYYRLYVPTLCVQIRVNNWKLVPFPGRSVVTSLVLLGVALSARLTDPCLDHRVQSEDSS